MNIERMKRWEEERRALAHRTDASCESLAVETDELMVILLKEIHYESIAMRKLLDDIKEESSLSNQASCERLDDIVSELKKLRNKQ